jgi:hypothetical protein
MPAFDLAKQTATLSRFDVVGQHSETPPGFVKHVALLNADEREVGCEDTVHVVHMGPPLETDRQLSAAVAGRIPLTNDQINCIDTWIAKIKDEYQLEKARRRQQYIIDPPWKDVRDENTGVRRYRRYSCAGFVLYTHLQVNISLLIIDKEELPEVTRQTLEAAYPDVFRSPVLLNRFGLQGSGPWRVVLAGYVLHALDRNSDEIRAEPYLAQGGDELF